VACSMIGGGKVFDTGLIGTGRVLRLVVISFCCFVCCTVSVVKFSVKPVLSEPMVVVGINGHCSSSSTLISSATFQANFVAVLFVVEINVYPSNTIFIVCSQ